MLAHSGTPDSHQREQVWRRALLLALPAAALAFALGCFLDPASDQSTPFDLLFYPLFSLGIVVLELLLWRRIMNIGQVGNTMVVTASVFFFSKLVYILFFLPVGRSVQTEMTESFFWIPSLYIMSLFIPRVRMAQLISVVFFSAMLLTSLLYGLTHPWNPHTAGIIFALIELNLANLTALSATNVFISLKEQHARGQAESETLQRLAYTDLLTDLPNRLQLEHNLQAATSQTQPFCLLFIDVDGFKLVNDTLGHGAGDEILRRFAERIQAFLKPDDLAARISGDEFVMVLSDLSAERGMAMSHHILDALTRPYTVAGQLVQLTASIGVSLFPEDGRDAETVLRHADAAMYHVKSTGKNGVRRFDGALDAELEYRKLLERELQFALQGDQLSLRFQPIFDLKTGAILKAEALLRWHHPQFGEVHPSRFIPIAESSGQVIALGEWVLRSACQQARIWREQSGADLVISVNVSPLQFAQHNFVKLVKQTLQNTGLPARALELEITEGAVIHQPDTVQSALRELQRLGVSIAIDDFGTGYSSLSYLRDLPINAIKIDRSFVADLGTPRLSPQYAAALIEAIVGIAQTLDLQVVAEGIENSTQLELLRNLGCDQGQGFYFARPSSAEAMTQLLMHREKRRGHGAHLGLN